MTGISSLNKMFRWLRDKKRGTNSTNKPDRSSKPRQPGVDDDYGFKKKQIILQETENGHSVIIKDDETTLVYPQSFCRLNYRARMPTPVQHVRETSTHIYDEIPEIAVRTRLQFESNQNEADIIKDARASSSRNCPMDFKNAIEVGPYLIVPIVNNSADANGDVEIFKRNEFLDSDINREPPVTECHCQVNTPCTCNSKESYSPPWDANSPQSRDVVNDTKVVLTRCVKSKSGTLLSSMDNVQPMCSFVDQSESNVCSFVNGACNSDTDSPTLTEISDSRTLIEIPDELSDSSEPRAIAGKPAKPETTELKHPDSSDTCCEYDLSTSGESDKSAASDYELYLSKIENNLRLKHDVRKIADDIGGTITENDVESPLGAIGDENETMTYVSSLSEYSSAASHISDISADRSASDDSGGFYECSEEVTESRDKKRHGRVSLERSVSAPETGISSVKSKKTKDKVHKSKKSSNSRSNSFDHKVSGFSSSDEKEVYKFPSSDKSSSKSSSSRKSRGKAVLAPQPTPVYMDPYRGKSRSHNRLLGDLIRMNYDKQLFTH